MILPGAESPIITVPEIGCTIHTLLFTREYFQCHYRMRKPHIPAFVNKGSQFKHFLHLSAR